MAGFGVTERVAWDAAGAEAGRECLLPWQECRGWIFQERSFRFGVGVCVSEVSHRRWSHSGSMGPYGQLDERSSCPKACQDEEDSELGGVPEVPRRILRQWVDKDQVLHCISPVLSPA